MNKVSSIIMIMLPLLVAGCAGQVALDQSKSTAPAVEGTAEEAAAKREKRGYFPNNDGIGHIATDADSLSAARTVENQARKKKRMLDLTPLNMYGSLVTKADLRALASPDCAGNLKELTMKYVSFSPDAFEALKKIPLETLDLAHSNGEELTPLSQMPSLRKLILSCVRLKASDYKVLGAMTKLTSLNLKGANVSDRDLPNFYGLKNLVHLDLSNCSNVSEKGLASLRQRLTTCEIQYGTEVGERVDQRNVLPDDLGETENLNSLGRFKEAEQLIRDNIAFLKSRKSINYDRLIQAYALLGSSLAGQASGPSSSYFTKAKEAYETAIKIAKEHDRLEQLQKTLDAYALCLEAKKKRAEAIEVRLQCQHLSEQHSDRTHSSEWKYWQRTNLSRLAGDYAYENQLERAAVAYESAANLAVGSPASENEAASEYLAARNFYKQTKNLQKSTACQAKAKKLTENLNSRCLAHWSCEDCLNLALRYLELSEGSDLSEIKRSHDLYEQVVKHNCLPVQSCQALTGLSQIDQIRGQFADAIAHAQSAAKLADNCGNLGKPYKAFALIEIGRIEGNQRHYKTAIDALTEAETLLSNDAANEGNCAKTTALKAQFSAQLHHQE